MRLSLCLAVMVATPIAAAPGPPPPVFVMEAGEILKAPAQSDPITVARLFADDVVATENGAIVVKGKAAWSAWRIAAMQHYDGRTLGYSEGWSRDGKRGGELLVIDTFDDLDRSHIPQTFVVDARFKTRSTLYRFAADGLIHSVEISRVEGFWITR